MSKTRNNNSSSTFTTFLPSALLIASWLAVQSSNVNIVHAFSPATLLRASRTTNRNLWSLLRENRLFWNKSASASSLSSFDRLGEKRKDVNLFSSNSDDEAEGKEKGDVPQVLYPALSKEEINAWLSTVDVYALMTSGGEDGGDDRLHLLYGPDGSAVTYFFLTSESAETMASQLKEIGGGDALFTTPLSLGKVWFGLLDSQGADRVDGVEYRLVPDPRDLNGARVLLTESGAAGSNSFQSPFNEIPTFLDVRMRIPGVEEVEQLPVYLGLQNIIHASENMKVAEDSSLSSSPASINVADLSDLIKQMQQESTIDFRRSVLIPRTNMQ